MVLRSGDRTHKTTFLEKKISAFSDEVPNDRSAYETKRPALADARSGSIGCRGRNAPRLGARADGRPVPRSSCRLAPPRCVHSPAFLCHPEPWPRFCTSGSLIHVALPLWLDLQILSVLIEPTNFCDGSSLAQRLSPRMSPRMQLTETWLQAQDVTSSSRENAERDSKASTAAAGLSQLLEPAAGAS